MTSKTNLHLVIATVSMVLGLCGPVWAFSGAGSGTQADPYVITDIYELQEMNDDLTAYYVLGNDIDASVTSSWNGEAGFEPIGFGSNFFTGSFDGQMHVINGLYIDRRPDYGIGLFGLVGPSGTVENIGVVDSYVNGRMAVGALAGHSEGFINNCYSIGTAEAEADVGGLVGYTNKIITQCYSSGIVIAGGRIGGFTSAGGLIGLTRGPDSVISNCYSTAEVKSTSAKYQTGGFIGINKDTVRNCFSTGLVTAASGSYARGFCSLNQGSISGCYWDKQTSGKTSSSGGAGRTTAEMMQEATFLGWDFVEVWDIFENETYPFLRPILKPVPVAVDIKPGGCPNPLNLRSIGILPVAILGSQDFDVSMIDTFSIRLENVAAIRGSYEDVAAPVANADECECTEDGLDGQIDLTLKFNTQEIVNQLIMSRPDELAKGQTLALSLAGELFDGTGIEGTDCVKLVGNVSRWLTAKRWDANADGIINMDDFALFAENWLQADSP